MRLREFDEKERLIKANQKLTKYKTAAGADATAADAAGNFARGNRRFKGINAATKKQFDNDAKLSQLKEFAPGNGGESGRWYTDDQITDIVGDGWYNDLDVSGDIPKQQMIQQAQAWLDDQGYNVQVLNCKVNDDDMEWYIEGSFQNSNFAKKGVAEGSLNEFQDVTGKYGHGEEESKDNYDIFISHLYDILVKNGFMKERLADVFHNTDKQVQVEVEEQSGNSDIADITIQRLIWDRAARGQQGQMRNGVVSVLVPGKSRSFTVDLSSDWEMSRAIKQVISTVKEAMTQGVAEGLEKQQYLWHGSRQQIPMLEPRQSVDTGGAAGSNQNAIYATSDPKVAIAMGLTTPGSDTGMFPNDPQMVLFSGEIRKDKNVYLHKLPMNGPDGKPQFVQGGNSREFHSIPGVEGIKPIEIKEIPVNKYLNLIRKATPADLKLRKKYMKQQGVAEGKVINTYLWHGSRQKIPMLEPRQSLDTGDERFDNIMSRIRQEPTIPMYQSIKDEITEAFDYPYKLTWEKSSYGDIDASATLDDGNYLNISFNQDENQDGKLVWNVEFDRNYSQAVTGEGDAQRVFATVLSAIQIFIKKYKPLKLAFGASKEDDQGQNSQSRARLYDSLVQRYARAWGYRVFRADTGNLVIYEFSRIQKPKAVGEDYNNRFAKEGVAETNHWHAAGVADAERDVKRNPNRKVKTLNPRTQLKTMQDKQARHPDEVEQYSLGYRSINPALNEDAVMGKIEQSGQIVRILKKQHTVPFSSDKDWLLIDTDPAKGNKGLGIKWVPATTRFEWVRSYKDTLNQEVAESNVFTDARMNAIKADKDTFEVHGKTYQVTGDTTDERQAGVAEDQLDELSKDTIKNYVQAQPARIKGPAGLATTDNKKAARIVDPVTGDMRRAMDKYKDPKYGQQRPRLPEDSLAAMRRLAGVTTPAAVPSGARQYRHMPTAVQPR